MTNHLYDIFKHWGKEVYCISDTHFNDEDSFLLRKESKKIPDDIKTLNDYNNFIIKKINSVAGKTSTLIILGDIGDISYVKKLKAAYKVLIMGNHDKGASNYKRDYGKYHYEDIRHVTRENFGSGPFDYTEFVSHGPKLVTDVEDNHLFDEVYDGPLQINDKLILSHIPVSPLREYEFNIHGHTHSLPHKYNEQSLNMCAEAIDYKPFNLTKALMKGLLSKLKSNTRIYIDNINKRGSEI